MFTGVHILEQEILKSLPNNGCVVRSTYMPLVESGAPIYGFPDSSHFCDLGMPARYLEAHVGMLKGIFPMRGYRAPASGIVIDPSARIGSDVRIEPGTAIGPGAEIENNCTLRESIVLPGARVTESLHRQIALASGEVITPDSNL